MLDTLDRKLLRQLQKDGRISTTALAEAIGLSQNATSERMKRLQRDGIIEGFGVRLSPRALGRDMLIFIEVKLDRTTPDIFAAFERACRASEDVMECHMVAGGFDYLLKTRVSDMKAYRDFLSDVLLSLPGVRETHTYAVMEEIKSQDDLPI